MSQTNLNRVYSVVTCTEPEPVKSSLTPNTLNIQEHKGRFSNSNAVGRYCNCICHKNEDVVHMAACCEYTYRKISL